MINTVQILCSIKDMNLPKHKLHIPPMAKRINFGLFSDKVSRNISIICNCLIYP